MKRIIDILKENYVADLKRSAAIAAALDVIRNELCRATYDPQWEQEVAKPTQTDRLIKGVENTVYVYMTYGLKVSPSQWETIKSGVNAIREREQGIYKGNWRDYLIKDCIGYLFGHFYVQEKIGGYRQNAIFDGTFDECVAYWKENRLRYGNYDIVHEDSYEVDYL